MPPNSCLAGIHLYQIPNFMQSRQELVNESNKSTRVYPLPPTSPMIWPQLAENEKEKSIDIDENVDPAGRESLWNLGVGGGHNLAEQHMERHDHMITCSPPTEYTLWNGRMVITVLLERFP